MFIAVKLDVHLLCVLILYLYNLFPRPFTQDICNVTIKWFKKQDYYISDIFTPSKQAFNGSLDFHNCPKSHKLPKTVNTFLSSDNVAVNTFASSDDVAVNTFASSDDVAVNTFTSSDNVAVNTFASNENVAVLKVIKLELILKLKIKHNDWLLADTCLQAANHCAYFEFETVLKFYNL